MSNIGDIRDTLRTRLETLPRIRVGDELPGPVTGQADGAVISYTGTQYMIDTSGNAMRGFTVTVLAGLASDRSAIDRLDAYCDVDGATSIYATLSSSIADVAHDVRVVSDSGHQTYTVGTGTEAVDYLGVEFTLEVMV